MFWVLGSRFRVWGVWVWVLGFGFGILEFGDSVVYFLTLGSRFWDLGF